MIVLPINDDIVKYVISEYLWTHNWPYNTELKRLCKIVKYLNSPKKISFPLPLNVIMYVISEYLYYGDLILLDEHINDLHINTNKIRIEAEKALSFSSKEGLINVNVERMYFDDILQKIIQYHTNGNIYAESYYVINRKCNGLTRIWHRNGIVYREIYFYNDKPNDKPLGLSKEFSEDGTLVKMEYL